MNQLTPDDVAKAAATLESAFQQRDRWAGTRAQPRVGIFGNGMPENLVAAAGAVPVHLSMGATAEKHAVASIIEPFVDEEVRIFLIRLMRGDFSACRGIIFARDDAPALIAYQYATEWIRQRKPRETTPPLFLWNLVHTSSDPVRRFNAVQAEKLFEFFQDIGLTRPDATALGRAAADEVRRMAALEVMQAAVGARLSGTTAMCWRNAGRFMSAGEHAALLEAAVMRTQVRDHGRRRIGVVGSPLASAETLAMLEAFGTVVCDLQPFGSIWPGPGNVASDLYGILDAAAGDTSCPRITPASAHRAGILARLLEARCDLVVCQLAQTDDTFGWEIPRLSAELEERGIALVNLGFRDPEPSSQWLDQAASTLAKALEARP